MAEQLTKQQYAAVHDRGGKLLVSAAAGSGKTKVLVDRLLSYLLDPVHPANIDDFLMITYTKAAAAELRGKIAAKLSQVASENPHNRHLQKQMQRLYLAKISTVHGFCGDVLREQAYRLDIAADFRVADENECRQLQQRAMDKVLEEAYQSAAANVDFRAFVDTQGLGRDDRLIPEIILQVYKSAKCHLDPDQWLSACVQAWDTAHCRDAGDTIWGKYLIADLKKYLQWQIECLQACIQKALAVDGFEKPAALLSETVSQLCILKEAKTWDEIASAGRIDYGRLTFPKCCTDGLLCEQIKAVRNACKAGVARKMRNFADTSDQILQDLNSSGAAARGLIALVKDFDRTYDSLKRGHHILDFGDLEHKTLDLFLGKSRSSITATAIEVGGRFREIMVDEYQDSNQVQDAIFSALTAKRNNCFMVGDVKQSIYQFRLADPEIFIQKYNDYLPAEKAAPGEGRKVLLSSNFRSSGGVISAVNDVFSTCMSEEVGGLAYGPEEKLVEGIPHIALTEPGVSLCGILVQEDTYREEAVFVANKIAQLLDGSHYVREGESLRAIQPQDIVILLRSPGSVGGEFRYALEERGIPCTTGDNADLLQTAEVSTLRALLQVISNPLQEIPLIAVLTSPVFCFTADELALLRSGNRKENLFNLLQQNENEKAKNFCGVLSVLRKDARWHSLSRLMERIFAKTRLDSYYAAFPDGLQKLENLQAFCQIAANYESTGQRDLEQFLAHLDVIEEYGLGAASEAKPGNAVSIMSIHKSKGLEFPVVLLCGLSREFNRESVRKQVLCHKEMGLGLSCVDIKNRVRYPSVARRAIAAKIVEESISEELRVLYVAMTRARDRLIMTYAAKNFDGQLQELALRKDVSSNMLLCKEADCPGLWVLLTALGRTEAGELFRYSGVTPQATVKEPFWEISVTDGVEQTVFQNANHSDLQISAIALDKMRIGLAFQYPHQISTELPSKQTATQLKGRFKDAEAAENAQEIVTKKRSFAVPSFSKKVYKSTDFGTAMHAVLQYIRYEECHTMQGVEQEIHRLVASGLITQQQAELVDSEKIYRFFATSVGEKLRSGCQVLREFKFTILEDAAHYTPGVTGEKVLLQGVVDCAILEPDGITVIDFKTDRVSADGVKLLAEQYRPQVAAYARSLARIYESPVKQSLLYFFGPETMVSIDM